MLAALLLAAASLALTALAQGTTLTINTPTTGLEQCLNKRISWSGGTPPYIVRAYPGGDLAADPLATIAVNTGDTSATWRVNIPAGTTVTLAVQDDAGNENAAAQVTVADNPTGDASCIGENATTSSSPSESASASAAESSTSAESESESARSTSSASARASSASASSRSASSTSTSAEAAQTTDNASSNNATSGAPPSVRLAGLALALLGGALGAVVLF